MKKCYLCKELKSLSNFTQRIDDRYYNMCQQCVSSQLTARGTNNKTKHKHTESHRTCYLCLRFLENDRFTWRSNGSPFSACKECNKYVFGPRRRARKLGASGSFTSQEWRGLVAVTPKCMGCSRSWSSIEPPENRSSVIDADHIIPLSRGGSNDIGNIQALCWSCNGFKSAKVGFFINAKFWESNIYSWIETGLERYLLIAYELESVTEEVDQDIFSRMFEITFGTMARLEWY